jgi:hypothetical protein
VGWIAAGTGAVALGVGGVFGALALGKKGTVRDECRESGGALLCTQAGLDAASSGHTFATISNVGFGVGIVGLALGGTLLLVTKPSGAETALRVRSTASGGSLSLEGKF